MKKLPNRIRELRKAKGLSLERLAELSEVSISYLGRIETGERRMNSDSLAAIAKALGVPPAALILPDSQPNADPLPIEAPADRASPSIKIIGEVAAGVWREANADAFEPMPVSIAHDGRFPIEALYALRVRGTSINRQAPDGSLILCLDAFHAPRPPRDGDWIVARRTRNGFAETTVKRFRVREDGSAFLEPDSTDPNHQAPIAVGDHDGDDVQVVAFVLDFIRKATEL